MFERSRCAAVAVVLLALASGCSAILDTDSLSGTDAGVDVGMDLSTWDGPAEKPDRAVDTGAADEGAEYDRAADQGSEHDESAPDQGMDQPISDLGEEDAASDSGADDLSEEDSSDLGGDVLGEEDAAPDLGKDAISDQGADQVALKKPFGLSRAAC